GLELEHHFELLPGRPLLEERIVLRNRTDTLISLADFEAGFVRQVTDRAGQVSADVAGDRWVAVPLRARATDPKGYVNDFSIPDLITKAGYEPRVNKDLQYSQLPSRHRASEGWAWTHGSGAVGIFVFNQENMLFSVVSAQKGAEGAALRLIWARFATSRSRADTPRPCMPSARCSMRKAAASPLTTIRRCIGSSFMTCPTPG